LSDAVIGTYDHTTPITHQGELPRCLESLREMGITASVMLLVAAEEGIDAEAAEKIHGIAASFAKDLNIQVIDAQMVSDLHDQMARRGSDSMIEGIGLRGYGAIRNLGLLAAAVRGFEAVIFIDDDEIVTDPDFVEQALHGLGRLSPKGVPILVKSGYYTDAAGNWRSQQKTAWYNRFWSQGELHDQWMAKAMAAARLSPSNVVNGGCMALHQEAFIRISFDAWISRGEDIDYLLNVLMYGGRVWFDNRFNVKHQPPTAFAEGQRFRQDIYRWVYEFRKLEYAQSQIDLLQVNPRSLDPFPGPFLEKSVSRRALATALLRTIGRPRDRQGYLKAALAASRDAQSYALTFCSRYFEFQRLWPRFVSDIKADPDIQGLFAGGIAEPMPEVD
jgi:GT2 family glycosyltransferase